VPEAFTVLKRVLLTSFAIVRLRHYTGSTGRAAYSAISQLSACFHAALWSSLWGQGRILEFIFIFKKSSFVDSCKLKIIVDNGGLNSATLITIRIYT
jgi:hypothetical protein